jgi:acetoin utilization deacetylase AcuC-like enzyme
MRMKVFFNPNMSTDSHGFSPSAAKPAKAVTDWMNRGLDIEIVDFEPATAEDICLAHEPTFVADVLSCRRRNGHGNMIQSVIDSCLWTVGSLVAASRAALTERITCSPTSGFHHAGWYYNGAFCSLNGLIVAARKVMNEGLVSRTGIIDCDIHYGDGTQDIINVLSLDDQIKHWTYGRDLEHKFTQKRLISKLNKSIRHMKKSGVELIILQAGADPHIDDPLGGDMTTEEIRERDQFVFELCNELGLPIVFNFAGGYTRDENGGISGVLQIHRNTAIEAIRVLDNWGHISQTSVTKQSEPKGNAVKSENKKESGDSGPQHGEPDPQATSDPPSASDPAPRKRIQMRDTTNEKKGMLAIIGARAPRKNKR